MNDLDITRIVGIVNKEKKINKTQSFKKWSQEYNISIELIEKRLNLGWSIKDSILLKENESPSRIGKFKSINNVGMQELERKNTYKKSDKQWRKNNPDKVKEINKGKYQKNKENLAYQSQLKKSFEKYKKTDKYKNLKERKIIIK